MVKRFQVKNQILVLSARVNREQCLTIWYTHKVKIFCTPDFKGQYQQKSALCTTFPTIQTHLQYHVYIKKPFMHSRFRNDATILTLYISF